MLEGGITFRIDDIDCDEAVASWMRRGRGDRQEPQIRAHRVLAAVATATSCHDVLMSVLGADAECGVHLFGAAMT